MKLTQTEKLSDALDCTKYVHVVEEKQIMFVWNGGHTINIYDTEEINCLDCFSVGHWKDNEATIEDVQLGIDEKIKEIEIEIE